MKVTRERPWLGSLANCHVANVRIVAQICVNRARRIIIGHALMSVYHLKNLLSPCSIALIGASPRPNSVGHAILQNIMKGGFAGDFAVVNSRYPEIGGVATAASLDRLPFVPELIIVTTPAPTVPGLIDQAGGYGVSAAVIVSAVFGFGAGSLSVLFGCGAFLFWLRFFG